MSEEPTERTYVAELIHVIKQVGNPIGFDASQELKTPSGYPDIVLYYRGKPVAIIEVKRPEVPLSDPDLNTQALRYAEWYRDKYGIKFYGIHNMRYLKLFKYSSKRQVTILDFSRVGGPVNRWVPVSDFPFKIMPWVNSINEYKHINSKKARENIEKFLLHFKEILEGRTLDLSGEVIETIRRLIERAAIDSVTQFKEIYERERVVKDLVGEWLRKRGLRKPRNDMEFLKLLKLLLKEQYYTFTMKILFYLVLQSIDAEMAAKLRESIKPIEEASDPEVFKAIANTLFRYAIRRTGDFEEIFSENIVDRLPFTHASLPHLKEIVRYLSQIRWSDISVDVIGRIFEGLIYEERRHLLGQHYTDTKIVDLILTGVFLKDGKPDRLLDPACGSGTFLVRAINYWRIKYGIEINGSEKYIHDLVEGIDIDRLASMLAKINLYIQALDVIKKGHKYVPKVYHADFFKINLDPVYKYMVANPPYTRQEEMAMAYYDDKYKENLRRTVSDIEGWSERASIYAYFLVRGGKLLRENGRLGFIVENSWLNAEYGKALKHWLFNNFQVDFIIESLVERWFKDAAIITNILIARKTRKNNYITRFIFLKRPLKEIFGEPPPTSDYIACERYYERISELYGRASKCIPVKSCYDICEDKEIRIVSLTKELIDKIETSIGRLGIIKGPTKYLDLVLKFIDGEETRIRLLGEIINIRRGLTTNANDIFYLPSRYWSLVRDNEQFLTIRNISTNQVIKISKKYLRRLIRPVHLRTISYKVENIPTHGREDYVLWINTTENIGDPGAREYVKWAERFVIEEFRLNRRYPTLYRRLSDPSWLRLPSTSGGLLLFRSAIHKNYSVWLLSIADAEVDKRLYIGYISEEYRNIVSYETLFAVANSIITYLGMELLGRANLGEGVLDITTIDYEHIPIIDPIWLENYLKEKNMFTRFREAVHRMLMLKPSDIDYEVNRKERLEVERYVLEPLGFSLADIKTLYSGLIELINFRTQRARYIS